MIILKKVQRFDFHWMALLVNKISNKDVVYVRDRGWEQGARPPSIITNVHVLDGILALKTGFTFNFCVYFHTFATIE